MAVVYTRIKRVQTSDRMPTTLRLNSINAAFHRAAKDYNNHITPHQIVDNEGRTYTSHEILMELHRRKLIR